MHRATLYRRALSNDMRLSSVIDFIRVPNFWKKHLFWSRGLHGGHVASPPSLSCHGYFCASNGAFRGRISRLGAENHRSAQDMTDGQTVFFLGTL